METAFLQDTLTDNKQIFERIFFEITQAKDEILVAMAWFTDPELFAALESKLKENVRVSIILSEQSDNDKLDFSGLKSQGAEVISIKNVGYGMMHQKFCVIDKKLAISGSYNWTVNAKTNNHETVIVTSYEKTVNELIDTFNNIKSRSIRLSQGEALDQILKSEKIEKAMVVTDPIGNTHQPQSIQEQSIKEFKSVLDSIIAAEVGNFDKELLRQNGYTRSKDNNGDHQVLPQAMDSVYSNFINDIDVIEERKNKLSTKIEEQQRLSVESLESKISYEEKRITEENRVNVENAKRSTLDLESEKDTLNIELKNNNNTRIPFIREAIEVILNKIKFAEREFIKPAISWPIMLTCFFMFFVLASYIFVFYSSVAYILVFSKEDINEILLRGRTIEVPEIFNPHVFEKIGSKGTGGILFLLFFVGLPYCLGLLHIFKINLVNDKQPNAVVRWFRQHYWLLLIIIVDIFIAFKVSRNINQIEYATNVTNTKLGFLEVFTSDNFWLVFVFGALSIYLFKIVTTKLFALFDDRNPTSDERKNRLLIEQLQQELLLKQEEVHKIELENNNVEIKITTINREIEKFKLILDNLPIKFNDAITLLKQELEQGKERLINFSNIYKSHIANDKLPISVSALEDRINVFLEGWSKYLHDTYSMQIAERKTAVAIIEIETWKNQKIEHYNLTA